MMETIFIDGSARPNPGKLSGAIVTPEKEYIFDFKRLGTNNEAEYLTLIYYLEKFGKDNTRIYSDSQMLVKQLNGLWKVNSSLSYYRWFSMSKHLLSSFSNVILIWIPREQNLAGYILEK